MSKPIPNLFSSIPQPNPEGDKNDWKIRTASNGLIFYVNTKTKKSQWEKPEILKTPEEKLNSTDWQEHTTGDGKTFYYNAKLKQSVWKMPPEVKAIKEKQAELRKQMGPLDAQKQAGSKIPISFTSNIPIEQETPDYGPNYENLPHAEAVKIFMDLLRERTSPTMKWEQAQQLIKNDERFKVITSFSEQRKLFKEWVVESKNQERQEYKQRMQRARENFRHMLEERNVLTSDSKYYKVFHLFTNDVRWKALEDREREQTFQEYLDDLYEREKEEKNIKTKQAKEDVKKLLTSDPGVTPATKWDDVCEKYKDDPAWNELTEYDRLVAFSKWIIELDRMEHDEKRKNRRFQERKNREAFRDLLKEHMENGTLTHKTKWRHFIHVIKEDKRLYNMLGQNGSTPRELFEDQIEVLKDQYKRTKEDLKKLLKESSLKIGPETTLQDFETALGAYEEFKALDAKTKQYFQNYFVDKAKSKEKESQKKYKKALKRYTRFLKGLSDIKPDSEYKTFEKVIAENEQLSILKEEDKVSHFNTFIQDLKNQDEGQISDEGGDKTKKKKSKKKRSKRKKNYESSEGENPRESSEERSESRSRSKSQSRERRKKAKKEKRKSGKRSRSQSEVGSDLEKKPEKKVLPEKEADDKTKVSTMQVEKPEEPKPEEKVQSVVSTVTPQVEQKPPEKRMEEEKVEPAKPSEVEAKGGVEPEKEDQEEREEGETKESGQRMRKSRSKSSRSESRDRTRKKKEKKHSRKKSKKGDKKSKKKHRKRSYSPSDSSGDE